LYAIGRIGRDLKDSTGLAERAVKFDISRTLEGYLNDDNERMRSEAVVGLYRLGGEATRRHIDGLMEQEYSPVVLAAYSRMVKEADETKDRP